MSLSVSLAFWSNVITVVYFIISLWLRTASSSVEKHIFKTAGYKALDIFHVSSESSVEVMLDLDMMVSFSELKNMTTKNLSSSQRKRAIKRSTSARWKDGIVYYEIADNIKHMKDEIRISISYFTRYSCLRFQEDRYRLPRVQFSSGDGCWSDIGVENRAFTRIKLGSECQYVSTIIHEIGHAVGLFHEHNRPDRDRYIRIERRYRGQQRFKKINSSEAVTGGIPYDYRSIMHYSSDMTPRDSRYASIIGQVWNLSFRDLKLLNLVYRCSLNANCMISGRNCSFNGFVLSKSLSDEPACQCWCDSGDMYNDKPLALCSSLERSKEPVYELSSSISSIIENADNETCFDVLPDCPALKIEGLCFTEFMRMKNTCARTCNFCVNDEEMCLDYEDTCVLLGESGTCTEEGLQDFMNKICPKSCGQCTRYVSECDIQKIMEGKDISDPVNSSSTNGRWISTVIVFFFFLC